ncbi:MAG: restriction endonuclease subunit S, partial [Thiolinea sp.]
KELVGKTAVIPHAEEVLLYESMNMRARPVKLMVNSDYVNIFLMSRMAKGYIASFAKEAIGQASINQGQISSIIIPLPPFYEKERIFQQVRHLNSICDQLKTNLTQAQQTQLQLTDTLVEQAL